MVTTIEKNMIIIVTLVLLFICDQPIHHHVLVVDVRTVLFFQ